MVIWNCYGFVSDAAEFVQISRADDIRPTVHLYYFEQSKTIHRSWFTPNCLPLRKGVEVKFLFFFEQFCELVHKRIDILELPIDGGEADICNFVDALELLHRELADIDGSHLAVE